MSDPHLLPRRSVLKLAGGGLVAAGGLALGGWAFLNRDRNLFQLRHERTLMQTSVAVNVMAEDPHAVRHAIDAAYGRMAAAVAVLSRFDPNSAVSRLNRDGRLDSPPPLLRNVLDRALSISSRTDGDFDITVAPVLDYYLAQPRPMTLDPAARHAIQAREALVGYKSVAIGSKGIAFKRPGAAITLDGIAKGFVVDQGIAALREAGIEYALIDAGGDMRAIAGGDTSRFWNVGIVDPLHGGKLAAAVRLRNAALSTSGNYQVFFSSDRRLFHIVNPHTGFSPDRYSSVTVMAGEAMETDAMSVAGFSMPLPRLKQTMAERRHEWLVFSFDGRTRWCSRGLPLIAGSADVV
jgi:thiamine biosynthesis lipoprotein